MEWRLADEEVVESDGKWLDFYAFLEWIFFDESVYVLPLFLYWLIITYVIDPNSPNLSLYELS